MPAQRWKPVLGYEDTYEVSDDGSVRRVSGGRGAVSGRLLKPYVLPSGHLRLKLTRDGVSKPFLVHRLVAFAFLGIPPCEMEVCHGDGNPSNNRVGNLRWDTRSANARDAVLAGTHPQAKKTHCPNGHEYSEQNTHISVDGRNRHCRKCRRKDGQ